MIHLAEMTWSGEKGPGVISGLPGHILFLPTWTCMPNDGLLGFGENKGMNEWVTVFKWLVQVSSSYVQKRNPFVDQFLT